MLTVQGFVLVNLYSMYLGSFLVFDVKADHFEIVTLATPDVLKNEFKNANFLKFQQMNRFLYASNMLSMNTDYSYSVHNII